MVNGLKGYWQLGAGKELGRWSVGGELKANARWPRGTVIQNVIQRNFGSGGVTF